MINKTKIFKIKVNKSLARLMKEKERSERTQIKSEMKNETLQLMPQK